MKDKLIEDEKVKKDPYDDLFLDDKGIILFRAKKKRNNEICKCGHKYKDHDYRFASGMCTAKVTGGTCKCSGFEGKPFNDILIEVSREFERNKVFREIRRLENPTAIRRVKEQKPKENKEKRGLKMSCPFCGGKEIGWFVDEKDNTTWLRCRICKNTWNVKEKEHLRGKNEKV